MATVLVQGYLAHKKQRPPRTVQQEYAQGPMVVLWGGAVYYERVLCYLAHKEPRAPPLPRQGNAGGAGARGCCLSGGAALNQR